MEHSQQEESNDSALKNEDSENRLSNESCCTTKQDKKLIFSTKVEKNGEIKFDEAEKNQFGSFAYKIGNNFGKGKNKKTLDIVNEISFCILLIDEIWKYVIKNLKQYILNFFNFFLIFYVLIGTFKLIYLSKD